MASAVLASRNEPYWGERKVYMRKYTNSNANTNKNKSVPFENLNPNPYPNPTPKPIPKPNKQKQSHDPASNLHFRQREPSPLRETTSPNQKLICVSEAARESFHGGYVTFNLGAYTRRELKELKQRLVYELEQVRALKTRLETVNSEAQSGHPNSQFSTTRPPPLRLNNVSTNPPNTKQQSRTPKSYKIKKKGPGQGPGSKRTNPFSNDPNPKRPAVDPLTEKILSSMMKRCGQILGKLMKHKFAWVFNKPVDVMGLGLFDYHQVIKKPMDLGTVKSNLDSHVYKSPIQFATDVRLTFDNAMAYNPKVHDVHGMAQQLLAKFNEMFNPAYKKFEDEQLRVYGQIQIPAPVEPPRPPPALVKQAVEAQEGVLVEQGRVGKLPKPKARDPNKREMSFEEKANLGKELEELPQEKMMQLLLIVKKRNGHLAQDGDEIELDMGAIDTETLWELDRFVNNYKKMVSKIKRQELINNQVTPAQTKINKVNGIAIFVF